MGGGVNFLSLHHKKSSQGGIKLDLLPCGWSAGSRFWWQHNVSVVKVFDFKWWFAIRQIGSGPAIFRIMLKGCRFFICLHCKHIKKHYCLALRGSRTAGFIRPAVFTSVLRDLKFRRIMS